MSKTLANANPLHEGFPYVRTHLDSFETAGPDGLHTCLVYEPMREPIWLFQKRRRDGKLSFGILPKICDFGLAQRIIDSCRNIHPIQPGH